ncbi:MAG: hypothetical protein ACREP5_14915 [Candidatus Binatia bacterium]
MDRPEYDKWLWKRKLATASRWVTAVKSNSKPALSSTPDCNVEFLFVDGFAGEKFLVEIEATALKTP